MKNAIQRQRVLRQNNAAANAFTRECIEEALLDLLKTRPFDQITITELTQRAGVSRNAYYRNYASKEDILDGYLRGLIEELAGALKQSDPVKETARSWRTLLEMVADHYDQYRLLIEAGYAEAITSEMQRAINRDVDPAATGRYYSNCYWASALCAVVIEWVKRGMDTPVEELVEIGTRLMQEGIRTVAEFDNHC